MLFAVVCVWKSNHVYCGLIKDSKYHLQLIYERRFVF